MSGSATDDLLPAAMLAGMSPVERENHRLFTETVQLQMVAHRLAVRNKELDALLPSLSEDCLRRCRPEELRSEVCTEEAAVVEMTAALRGCGEVRMDALRSTPREDKPSKSIHL